MIINSKLFNTFKIRVDNKKNMKLMVNLRPLYCITYCVSMQLSEFWNSVGKHYGTIVSCFKLPFVGLL